MLANILLIDDDLATNFFHEMIIKRTKCTEKTYAVRGVEEAINYLKALEANGVIFPELIFLDINMPGMDGWDFVELYKEFDSDITDKTTIILLTTSLNPLEKEKADKIEEIAAFQNKPLSPEVLSRILKTYFPTRFDQENRSSN